MDTDIRIAFYFFVTIQICESRCIPMSCKMVVRLHGLGKQKTTSSLYIHIIRCKFLTNNTRGYTAAQARQQQQLYLYQQ